MTLVERVPEMSDGDLAVLHANALRLSVGHGRRSREAADLLPTLEAEIGARKARAEVSTPKRSRGAARRG